MLRTIFAAALATCTLGGCADYYGSAYYDDPGYGRNDYNYGDRGYRRDYARDDDRDYGRDYDRDRRRDGRRDHDHDRPKQRMVIEDAQYESVNGQRIDAKRYVRDECHNENNCDVKASNKIFGDPDVGAHKDLVVRYRCGKGPTRTVRVPEKSEQDIKC